MQNMIMKKGLLHILSGAMLISVFAACTAETDIQGRWGLYQINPDPAYYEYDFTFLPNNVLIIENLSLGKSDTGKYTVQDGVKQIVTISDMTIEGPTIDTRFAADYEIIKLTKTAMLLATDAHGGVLTYDFIKK
jgi:VCBS repeat-containing protein